MKIGIVQQTNGGNRADNIAKLETHIRECAQRGANLIVLPELHNELYFCQTENVEVFNRAETIPGPSTTFFGRIAEAYGVTIVLSLFEERAPGLYHNTAVALDPNGNIAGLYRKMHIPDDPAYYEKFYFAPGDLGFLPIPTSAGLLGVLICWDQWFPEAARLMAMRGADVLIYPTAIGWESSDTAEEQQRQWDAWQTIQRGHAIANGLHLVAVNRVGHEADPSGRTNGIRFWGSSFVAGPQGEILAQLSADAEEIQVVDIDLGRTKQVRQWWPFFRDRRTDAYEDLTKRFLR
ncbi:MAG: carbon-nitrogen hydrolase [Tannerellaceae bacterium]|jgi:N-carbamoylputrescine amidase|nr:carbon-nitrogen hydrolase [Tannerellaceae bacterium]